jgi:hypothetical protein
VPCALVILVVWYPLLQHWLTRTPFAFDPFRPALLGMTFNSMLDHLLHGRFDVDPAAIGFEAFLVDGRTIAYFGPFGALLRLPLLPFGALATTDITRLSCLVALCLSAWFQLRSIMLVHATLPPSPRRGWLFAGLALGVVFGGPLVQFLRPSIYQEVVDWASAEAMGFVYMALRGLLGPGSVPDWRAAFINSSGGSVVGVPAADHLKVSGGGSIIGIGLAGDASFASSFSDATLLCMAAFAGLALLTRVSVGLGLYVALVLLLMARQGRGALVPGLVLAGFAAIAAGVNIGRWGNPLTFADATRYAMNLDVTPDRIGRIATWGAFNPIRLPFGLSYYFVPVWGIIRDNGQLLFAAAQHRLMDAVELPAGSFLLTDPLLVVLACFGIANIRRGPEAAVAAGLAIPPVLMLIAISMAHRYRMEFYPFFLFTALLGWRAIAREAHREFGFLPRVGIVLAVVVGIVAAHAEAALYAVSPWGPAEQYLTPDSSAEGGWTATYGPRLQAGHD